MERRTRFTASESVWENISTDNHLCEARPCRRVYFHVEHIATP